MSKVILDTYENGLRVVTLNDPERRNILGYQMCADLLDAVKTVASDACATALVVAGNGPAFCGGADMPAIFGVRDRSVAETRDDLQDVYSSFLAIRELKVPTIAAVQGPAVGAGLNLAMVCDIRVVGPDAALAATFSRIGLHPGGGCTWFLVEALGRERALKMLLDGGQIRGREIATSGLAAVFSEEALEDALKLGNRYATMDPQLSRDIGTAVELASANGLETTLEFESWAQASAATKPAVHAYLDQFKK